MTQIPSSCAVCSSTKGIDSWTPTFQNELNVRTVDESHPEENIYLPLLAGSFELGQPHSSLTGWVVFEVQKDAELREMRWGTGEVFYLRLDQLQGALEDFTEPVRIAAEGIPQRLRNGRDGLDDVIEERKLADFPESEAG